MTRHRPLLLAAALLALLLLLLAIVPGKAAAADQYEWVGIKGPPGKVASADCDLGKSTGSIWAAVGGSEMLDIVQVGRIHNRFFAAWGSGVPEGEDSNYEQVDLGIAPPGPHRYTVWLKGHDWWFYIDGKVRIVVPDEFRTWTIRQTDIMAETSGSEHFGSGTRCVARLGGPWAYYHGSTCQGDGCATPPAAVPWQAITRHGRLVGWELGTWSAWRTSLASFYDFSTWGKDQPGGMNGIFACGGWYLRSSVAAAHRTLPCGTLVEFRHNGKTLIVPVRDRFGGGGFDLTSEAAIQLGHVFTGPVEWRIVK